MPLPVVVLDRACGGRCAHGAQDRAAVEVVKDVEAAAAGTSSAGPVLGVGFGVGRLPPEPPSPSIRWCPTWWDSHHRDAEAARRDPGQDQGHPESACQAGVAVATGVGLLHRATARRHPALEQRLGGALPGTHRWSVVRGSGDGHPRSEPPDRGQMVNSR